MAAPGTPEFFLLAARRAEIAGLAQLAASCRLVTEVSALVHQLQRERGISNVFLGSGGARFAMQRTEQVRTCINMERAFREELRQLDLKSLPSTGSMRLFNRLAWVLNALDGLPAVRQRISDQALTAPEATQVFSDLVAGLLSVVFEAADIATDPDITRLLVALFNFIQGKEYAGQERAWASNGFAAGSFPPSLCVRLRHLVDAQQRCFDTFAEFASPAQLEAWQTLETSEETASLARLREVMLHAAAGGALDGGMSEIWYELATRRIDRMKTIEDEVAAALLACSAEKTHAARRALRDHRSRLRQLGEMKAPPVTPLTLLMDASPDESGVAPRPLTAPGVNPELARSVYELVAAQAEHLRQVSDELARARQALDERKLLERAKGLLMQHHRINEAEAWRALRQAAMSSNRTLPEVARQVIEAASSRKA